MAGMYPPDCVDCWVNECQRLLTAMRDVARRMEGLDHILRREAVGIFPDSRPGYLSQYAQGQRDMKALEDEARSKNCPLSPDRKWADQPPPTEAEWNGGIENADWILTAPSSAIAARGASFITKRIVGLVTGSLF